MSKIRSFIKYLNGEDRDEVWRVIKEHPEWYGKKLEPLWLLNNCFYGIYNEFGELMGFFSVNIWKFEVIVSWVYIKEEYRKQGLFNKIIKFVKEKYYEYIYITISVVKENHIAREIYHKKFTFGGENEEKDGYWYVIVDRSKKV